MWHQNFRPNIAECSQVDFTDETYNQKQAALDTQTGFPVLWCKVHTLVMPDCNATLFQRVGVQQEVQVYGNTFAPRQITDAAGTSPGGKSQYSTNAVFHTAAHSGLMLCSAPRFSSS